MSIIRQEMPLFAVPDFRNLGVAVRIFASGILLMFALPLLSARSLAEYQDNLLDVMVWLPPSVLVTVLILSLLGRYLLILPCASLWTIAVIVGAFSAMSYFFHERHFVWAHLWSALLYALALLHYQALLKKAFSPAVAEARLSALTARIRPHFLFNSLNAAIGLVRTRPVDTETILENLADLFRAQLKDGNQPSTLSKEIELAQSYIAIERIRMGEERLKVKWIINAPEDAQTPGLLLQPLLENAVYHGIEPMADPQPITINLAHKGNWIYIRIKNARPPIANTTGRQGNHMALSNLKERLFLMYDRDATLHHKLMTNSYRVDIRLPYYPAEKKNNPKPKT